MLSCQKHLFFLPEDHHYLNCAYMSPMMEAVEAAGIQGIRRKRNPVGMPSSSFFEEANRLRKRFAALIGTEEAERVAIVPSVSYGMATVAQNTPVSPGQTIVVAHEQFPSNIYAWKRLEARGATLRVVGPPPTPTDRGAHWNARLLEAIDASTAAVCLGHVHWADGTRFDLDAIGVRCREVGAALVVDGTQSIGALPFEMSTIQPDAVVCAGYKWLMGPYSLGLAYYGPRYDEGLPLEDNWLMRRDSEDFSKLVAYQDAYQPGAIRYDVGQRSNFILVPMLIQALDQLLAWTPAAIQAYCDALLRPVLEEATTWGYQVEDPAHRSAHLVGIRAPAHVSMDHLKEALAQHRVAVSVRGSAIRVSPHVYNEPRNAEALREALHAAAFAAEHSL
ncbi:MAG: aminotransferase class V-fold PLP-dependent enzyme [Bacteroidota bacterium]